MARDLKTNVSQAISDFDAIKAALEKRGMEVGDKPTSEYGPMVEAIPQGGGDDDLVITDASYLFYYGKRIDILDALLSRCKDLVDISHMFANATVSELKKLGSLDTSKVKSFASALSNLKLLTSIDVSGWDTSSAETFSGLFSGDSKLESVGDISGWNISNVTSLNSMFNGCTVLKTPSLIGWDTSKVKNMNSMFAQCGIAGTFDFSTFSTAACTDPGGMFNRCRDIEELLNVTFPVMKAAYLSSGSPLNIGENGTYKLRRLTFAPNAVFKQAINIKNCRFTRETMQETFRSLPDVSAETYADTYKKITITGNPCLLNEYVVTGQSSGSFIGFGSYEKLCEHMAEKYGIFDYQNAPLRYYLGGQPSSSAVTGVFSDITPDMFDAGTMYVSLVGETIIVPEEMKLTDEDRAIATSKGWTLVE